MFQFNSMYIIFCNLGSFGTYYFLTCFSSSYISVILVFGKAGKLHFCFTHKEIFLLDDHVLCPLEDGTWQFLSFTADSPTSVHAKSAFDGPQESHLSGVTLSSYSPS